MTTGHVSLHLRRRPGPHRLVAARRRRYRFPARSTSHPYATGPAERTRELGAAHHTGLYGDLEPLASGWSAVTCTS
ncbi:hypothetical protein B1H18_27000 [Streptomyces tsukubensis]|uniref:Uncharacterized protein n=1 Tax=Streptomyces tsukubensis TaxID=83656 RepID=A0A1V4A2I2_9ACTN|nr:hypothetical protein B1H18_27000 [Streptomyces tsukubensis]